MKCFISTTANAASEKIPLMPPTASTTTPARTRTPLPSAEAGRFIAVKYNPSPTAMHTSAAATNEEIIITSSLFCDIFRPFWARDSLRRTFRR